MERRLYKSRENRKIAGVCGGIGEYFDIDPVIVRLLVVIFTLAGGAGLIGYIIAAIIIPERDGNKYSNTYNYEDSSPDYDNMGNSDSNKKSNGNSMMVFGVILLLLGAFVVLRSFVPWVSRELILATGLIAIGLYFIFKKS
jgi:phage shock protein C